MIFEGPWPGNEWRTSAEVGPWGVVRSILREVHWLEDWLEQRNNESGGFTNECSHEAILLLSSVYVEGKGNLSQICISNSYGRAGDRAGVGPCFTTWGAKFSY